MPCFVPRRDAGFARWVQLLRSIVDRVTSAYEQPQTVATSAHLEACTATCYSMLLDLAEVRWLAPPYTALGGPAGVPEYCEACTAARCCQPHTANLQACCDFLQQGGVELLTVLVTQMAPGQHPEQKLVNAAWASCILYQTMGGLQQQAMEQAQFGAGFGGPLSLQLADLARQFLEHLDLPALLDVVSATRHNARHGAGTWIILCIVHCLELCCTLLACCPGQSRGIVWFECITAGSPGDSLHA